MKFQRTILAAFTILAVLCFFSPAAQSDDIADLKAVVKVLGAQISDLQDQNASLKLQIQDLRKSILIQNNAVDKRFQSLESVVQVGNTVTIEAPAALVLKAPGTISILGALLKLNGGSNPVAFRGSDVGGTKVVTGSPTVLVP